MLIIVCDAPCALVSSLVAVSRLEVFLSDLCMLSITRTKVYYTNINTVDCRLDTRLCRSKLVVSREGLAPIAKAYSRLILVDGLVL